MIRIQRVEMAKLMAVILTCQPNVRSLNKLLIKVIKIALKFVMMFLSQKKVVFVVLKGKRSDLKQVKLVNEIKFVT